MGQMTISLMDVLQSLRPATSSKETFAPRSMISFSIVLINSGSQLPPHARPSLLRFARRMLEPPRETRAYSSEPSRASDLDSPLSLSRVSTRISQ